MADLRSGALRVVDLDSFRPIALSGLNLKVLPGKVRNDNVVSSYAGSTLVLTNNTVNYVETTDLGTVSFNTVGFSSGQIPIASVTTSGGAITLVVDARTFMLLATGGGGGAPTGATYITQTSHGSLSAEQALGLLASGILKSATGTGIISIAVPGTDYVTPSQVSFAKHFLLMGA
jgi:hypothetical protein